MSVSIKCRNIVKKYGANTVIPDLSLEIRPGEFFTLLGPSGCGKTTLLRMIAGFNSIEGGEISFNETVINKLPPNKRNTGMVFQNYAIFPHMTVFKNVAFGLKNSDRKPGKQEIETRVDKVLKTVKIDTLRDRMPANMSGGQQQRIALARAIVIEPDVLLMDEPLSNLDAKLRIEMREVIRDIQKSVGITTVYVTHDQEEAMAVSDRIAVMKDGIVQQVGTPRSIYHRPANAFVASFIGTTNLISGTLDADGAIRIADCHLRPALKEQLPANSSVKLSVRPEDFSLTTEAQALEGTVVSSTYLGMNTHYTVALSSGETILIIEASDETHYHQPGDVVRLQIDTEKINIYDATGELRYPLMGEEDT